MNKIESLGTKTWKGYAKTKIGIRHIDKGLKCQDYTEMKRKNGKVSISLVDGRGDTDINACAVKRIADLLNEFMIQFFEEILIENEKTVAYNLMLQVEREIKKMTEEYSADKKEMASTLIAFCIDEISGKYCAVHLGDGVIALKDNSDTVELLSTPMNGISSNQTFLTTFEYGMKYVNVYKGNIDEIKGVLLASDGIYNGREDRENLEAYFSERKEDVILEKKVDDQSIITMFL